MCIENTLPGEPKFLQKRRIPKALRFFKPKRDINPSRYFLHELMLYRCFDKNDYERWHDDDEAQKDYEKYKESKSIYFNVKAWLIWPLAFASFYI